MVAYVLSESHDLASGQLGLAFALQRTKANITECAMTIQGLETPSASSAFVSHRSKMMVGIVPALASSVHSCLSGRARWAMQCSHHLIGCVSKVVFGHFLIRRSVGCWLHPWFSMVSSFTNVHCFLGSLKPFLLHIVDQPAIALHLRTRS